MGKVFMWSEIEGGEIPQSGDFSTVVSRIRKDFGDADSIFGAVLCGSVIWGNFNRRSDIDCVVVYDPRKRREAVQIFREIYRAASRLYVPVELMPLDLQIARTPLHHIGHSFSVHLRRAVENGGLIKANPLPLFVFEDANAADDVCGYLRTKLRAIEKGVIALPTMKEGDLHRFLQKALEAPVHIARKILWWQRIEIPDDSKPTVMRFYREIASEQERALFAKITGADSQYTREILEQLQHPDKDRYVQTIERLKDVVWDTLDFVRLSALRVI